MSSKSSASASASSISSPSITSPTWPTVTTPFFSASPSTSGASPTGSSVSASPSSSSLYLYTFLATLVLLLGISAAIVIRSFVLRRRHQGVIEEAIRNGTWGPSPFGGLGRGRRDIGEKPRMWEAWVGKDRELPGTQKLDITDDDNGGEKYDTTEPGPGWNEILPISAIYLNPSVSSTIPTPNVTRVQTGYHAILPWRQRAAPSSLAVSPNMPSSSLLSLPTAARTVTSPLSSPPPPLPIPIPTGISSSPPQLSTPALVSPTPNSESASPPNPTLRLTVLVAMPSPPSTRHTRDDEEEGPPVVEFGLVDVDIRNSGIPNTSGVTESSNDRIFGRPDDKGVEAGS